MSMGKIISPRSHRGLQEGWGLLGGRTRGFDMTVSLSLSRLGPLAGKWACSPPLEQPVRQGYIPFPLPDPLRMEGGQRGWEPPPKWLWAGAQQLRRRIYVPLPLIGNSVSRRKICTGHLGIRSSIYFYKCLWHDSMLLLCHYVNKILWNVTWGDWGDHYEIAVK